MGTDISSSSDTRSLTQGRWRLDPAHSTIEFRTPTLWGLTSVRGQFERYEGSLDLQRTPAVELTLEAASLDTKLGLRDRHLRSRDFFDVQNHPQVRFESDEATLAARTLKVRGRLYAAGSSVPLELQATLRPVGEGFDIDARTHADHRRLGMSHGALGMIRGPSELIIRGRLVR